MAYSEVVKEHIEIQPNGVVSIKKYTEIYKDGLYMARTETNENIEPGDDLNGKSAEVIAHANVAFTPERVAAKAAQKAAEKAKIK